MWRYDYIQPLRVVVVVVIEKVIAAKAIILKEVICRKESNSDF